MRRIIAALLVAASGTAAAESDVNFGVSSEYVFRGVTQSNGAQVWGSFDWMHASTGLYTGLWVSNAGLRGNEEADFYAGYAMGLTEALSADIGVIGYFAPSAPSSTTGPGDNNAELYAGLNADVWNLYAYYNFGRNGRQDDEFAYVEVNYETPVLDDAVVRLHGGFFTGVGEMFDFLSDDSYVDYGISFVKDYGDSGQIALAVTATTIDENHGLLNEFAESDRPQFTVGWSRQFGAL